MDFFVLADWFGVWINCQIGKNIQLEITRESSTKFAVTDFLMLTQRVGEVSWMKRLSAVYSIYRAYVLWPVLIPWWRRFGIP